MTMSAVPTDLARRLERFRAAQGDQGSPEGPLPHRRITAVELAERLATTLDGEVVETPTGRFVRIEGRATDLPVDRARLAGLPGHPPPERPLVCLDTETTGLATATGTVAFLIGLGWWDGSAFKQIQLLLPDHGEEAALLDELARHLPPNAWLVTYNGRGFDWPLLVTRYRLARRAAPIHDGHLDLLPVVRRVFRHRMDDARLRTVERTLLGVIRHDDVDGWDIPGRYLGFLRGGPAQPLAAVVRHNDEDVRSLARLVALLDVGYATPDGRRNAPAGDLAGLARAYVRARRPQEALSCLDEVLARGEDRGYSVPRTSRPVDTDVRAGALPWWSPRVRPDFGGNPRPIAHRALGWDRRLAAAAPWDPQRIATDRALLLRRLGRTADSAEAWGALAAGPGRAAIVACIELAKLQEHRLGRLDLALESTVHGRALAERRRQLGMPEPALEADLRTRLARLRRRTASADGLIKPGSPPG
ncbi:MAG: ribonuclease H-like domain-containing protein [Candidatus Limnocylindrales bacterium]